MAFRGADAASSRAVVSLLTLLTILLLKDNREETKGERKSDKDIIDRLSKLFIQIKASG